MTSPVSFPSLSPSPIQTIRSVGGSAAIQAAPAPSRTLSPAGESGSGLPSIGAPPAGNVPRGSLLNLTV